MKVAFHTLGCKVNQYETEVIRQAFIREGYEPCDESEIADVYIVNSCTVTGASDKKTISALRRFRRLNPSACIAVTGCFSQAFPKDAQLMRYCDVVTGANNKNRLVELVGQYLLTHIPIVEITPHDSKELFEPMKITAMEGHTRAFVKIEDGCDRFCSYCIIPFARGRVRSKPLDELKTELVGLAEGGYKEVVLVGINLSLYGYGDENGHSLLDAVRVACDTDGIERVRLGSLEPDTLTLSDIEQLAVMPKLCDQFHLSLQSGCDATLLRMNRGYSTKQYADIVSALRKYFPNCAITTDIMVGFAGETDEEFAQSLEFARKIGFARTHVFAYSQREGTAANNMAQQINADTKRKRSLQMKNLAKKSRSEFLESQVGRVFPVLFEANIYENGREGHTSNYTPVRVDEEVVEKGLHRCIKCVKIVRAMQDYCIGELV